MPPLSYSKFAEWAHVEFELDKCPSKAMIANIIGQRHDLKEAAATAKVRSDGGEQHMERKRKYKSPVEISASLRTS